MFQEVNTVTEIWPRQASALTHQRYSLNVASRSDQLIYLPLVPGREPTPQRIVHPHIELPGPFSGNTACPRRSEDVLIKRPYKDETLFKKCSARAYGVSHAMR